MMRVAAALLLAIAALPAARAASLNGVDLPDSREVAGTALRLNGIGLRTYSLLRIPIYVAGLYLERPDSDADAILHSSGTKLLDIHFLHDVDAEHARTAWREGFEKNCRAPCRLDPQIEARFLAAVVAMPVGAHSTLAFAHGAVAIEIDEREMGTIADPQFASLILATFIGPEPPTERLKRELLGGRP